MTRNKLVAVIALLTGCYGKSPDPVPEPMWTKEPTSVLGVGLYKPLPKIPNCPLFSKYSGSVKGLMQYGALYDKLPLCRSIDGFNRFGGAYDAPILGIRGLMIGFDTKDGVVKAVRFDIWVSKEDLLTGTNHSIKDMQELLIERYGPPTSVEPFNGYEIVSRWSGTRISMSLAIQDQRLKAQIIDNDLLAENRRLDRERAATEAAKRASERSRL